MKLRQPRQRPWWPRALTLLIVLGLTASFSANAWAQKKSLCVFDVSGANGDAFAIMKDYQVAAAGWGVDFELKPYTNEKTAADDFKAGKCDAVLLTGLRARTFNKFSSTLEAMGAIPSYDLLEKAIGLLSGPKAGDMLKSGDYETVVILPMGAVYLFVKDKSTRTIESLAGKTIATIDFDQAAKTMVREAGASLNAADISTFAGMFNNGAVDACYSPATAYKPLELEKGIKSNGGIVRYPLAQLTAQVIIRSADFPAEFALKSREWSKGEFGRVLKIAKKAEDAIPAKYWIDVPDADRVRYDQLFLDVRVRLRDTDNVYDKQMLTLMRRLRCQADKSRAECAEKRE